MTPAHKKSANGRPRKTSAQLSELARRRKQDGSRLNAALQQLGLSQAEAARRSGVKRTYLNAIANGERDISREDLRRLAEVGISADFLLGRDVGVAWQQRSPIGALGDGLRAEIARSHPALASHDEYLRKSAVRPVVCRILPDDDVALVRELVDHWARDAFRRRVGRMARALRDIGIRMRRDSTLPEHAEVADLLQYRARTALHDSRFLRSDPGLALGEWSSITDLDEASLWRGLIEQEIGCAIDDHGAIMPFATPFYVPYKVGFAYSSEVADHVWYIDPVLATPRYGRGRFLTAKPGAAIVSEQFFDFSS